MSKELPSQELLKQATAFEQLGFDVTITSSKKGFVLTLRWNRRKDPRTPVKHIDASRF